MNTATTIEHSDSTNLPGDVRFISPLALRAAIWRKTVKYCYPLKCIKN